MNELTINEEQFAFAIELLKHFGFYNADGWKLWFQLHQIYEWFDEYRQDRKLDSFYEQIQAFFHSSYRPDIINELKFIYDEQ